MKKYKHLTCEQRYQIECLLQTGQSQTKIASILGVHKSTISRELKRNTPLRGRTSRTYIGSRAEYKTRKRHKTKPKKIRLTESLKERISELLRVNKWSPELISKRLPLEGEASVSHECIYQWIWTCKHSNHRLHKTYKHLYKYLRYTGRRQKRSLSHDKRGSIKHRVSIEDRPKDVDKRKRIGDIEVDLMIGKNHKSALLVMTDRATLVTMIEKLANKSAEHVYSKIVKRLSNINKSWIKTITFDNGKEFALHYQIAEDFNVKTYFTRPYTSQDKGTVENRIGVIRRFFPKKTDLNKISDKRIKEVEKYINFRPIQKFNYKNPMEVLKNRTVALLG